MLKKVLIGALGAAAVLTVGILLGHYAIDKGGTMPDWVKDVSRDLDETLVQEFLAEDPDSGLDRAWEEQYLVYLSFPDPKKPNTVTVVAPDMSVLHKAREREKSYGPDQDDQAVVQAYAAYSPAGQPKGRLVYANQGKPSDYKLLNETLDLKGTIAITRYGGSWRADKTYPHSWYMPPSGMERGSFNTNYGDMLTPYLAAKEHTYRIPVENITGIPPIPIQPIGFEDAYILISELGGQSAPPDWQGAFNCTYNFGGPGFKPESKFHNSDVKLEVFNFAEVRNSSNVMGYVIYGNHRDSWVHGAIDPSSGTSVMLEVTRVLGRMLKQGRWRPRRSVIFGSWGAEEFGLIGSAEYTEQYYSMLSERTVAYINVDIAVFANATLRASCMPSVEAPGRDSKSVYDNWIQHSNRSSPAHGTIPRVGYLSGAGSDYAAFVHYLGITSMDISYTYDRTKTNARIYPAYHTAYDTFDYASRFIDPEPLKSAVSQFRRAAAHLDQLIQSADLANEIPLKARGINDQLMLLDRAFLDPQAFPEKYGFRHVIWASSSAGKATFPGLANTFARASSSGQAGDWAKVHHQLSILSQAIQVHDMVWPAPGMAYLFCGLYHSGDCYVVMMMV
ncbi:hypothetical protein CRUP_029739 [Coryphaenoides rupestris]|nr:hypothetical protein CRUP_029739 [Coryphaenoides rupestris]